MTAAEAAEATEAAEDSGEAEPGAEQKSSHTQALLARPADSSEAKGALGM